MDKVAYEATSRTVGKWIVPLAKAQHIEKELNAAQSGNLTLAAERDAMRDWIMLAAPMLSVASCIVTEEAVERLGEIEGCRGVLELCPVDFINPLNVPSVAVGRERPSAEA